ncbi:MAG: preprotein translocase subunit SecE [Eubacteriales bacterium]|nr:preprotein translocase subunit SecE [Eubacteriales bacterium]
MAENQTNSTAKAKESKKKDKKPNFFVRLGRRIAKFCRESWSELKKVVWMSGKELRKSTLLVVVSVIILSAAIALIDYAFTVAIQGIAGLPIFNA